MQYKNTITTNHIIGLIIGIVGMIVSFAAGHQFHPIPPPFPSAYEHCLFFPGTYSSEYCVRNATHLRSIRYR